MTEINIRPMAATRRDAELFAACFEKNGFPREIDSVEWQFFANPVRDLYVDFAEANAEELAAIYACFPSHFKVSTSSRIGVQSLDTLTDEDHRGKGLFKKLAASVYSRCEQQGVQFIYGFPNNNSAHGFFNRLGWTSMDPVPFLIKPLRSRYFAARIPAPGQLTRLLPNVSLARTALPQLPDPDRVRPAISFDDFDVEDIWQAFSSSFAVGIRRDTDYLKWRFSKPREKYKTLVYESAGVAKGFVTYAVKEKHGGRIGYVLELMHYPGQHAVGTALLRHSIRDMVRQEADAVLAWCFSHSANHSSYRKCGFLPLPERLRPIQLHFGARRLAGDCPAEILDRRSWYISYCDSDTV